MTTVMPGELPSPTHVVDNQPPALEPCNLFRGDTLLREGLAREDGDWGATALDGYAEHLAGRLYPAARQAEAQPPRLRSYDRYGHRIDRVDYAEGYHRLLGAGIEAGIPSMPWTENRHGSHVVRAAHIYLHHQVDAGSCCPMTMSFAAVPSLCRQPDVAEHWLPRLTARHYDPEDRPWYEKAGVTLGMAMTEKQGGTDVRANSTRAQPVLTSGPGRLYRLTGHKWFCSAPMSDGFLTLAQAGAGLSCFLLPRWRQDGQRNAILIQRLKDKLGNRSNASSEVEFHDAEAWLIGEEGRGVATIMDMVALTRFDCVIGSAALMRQALVQALHHCRHRHVMGRALLAQPLMRNVLADLALESEAALLLALHLATQLERAEAGEEPARVFMRVATGAAKYWVCRRTPAFVNEAAECLGGAGYVEESLLPWLYREAPLNATWEGCSNVQCLDVLRALERTPDALDAVLAPYQAVRGANPHLDRCADTLRAELQTPADDAAFLARDRVGRLALLLQASLLQAHAPAALAEAFCASRLQNPGAVYGLLRDPAACDLLLERAWQG